MNLKDVHNHTIWSDGENTIEEMVLNAIEKNVSVIGISDHFNTNKCKSVSINNLSKYLKEINVIKKKYKDKVEVLAGMEICILPYPNSMSNIPIDLINKFDFVLIEYLDLLAPSIDLSFVRDFLSKITCKKGLAHTDLIKLSNKFNSLEDTIKFLKDNDLYWELNSSSSCEALYDISSGDNKILELIDMLNKYNIEVIPGSDTHDLIDYEYGRLNRANKLIEDLFIKRL